MKNKKFLILLISGILLAVSAPLLSHYITLPDVIMGLITGVGLGLLIVSIKIMVRNVKAQ